MKFGIDCPEWKISGGKKLNKNKRGDVLSALRSSIVIILVILIITRIQLLTHSTRNLSTTFLSTLPLYLYHCIGDIFEMDPLRGEQIFYSCTKSISMLTSLIITSSGKDESEN